MVVLRCCQVMKRNVTRLKKIVHSAQQMINVIVDCLDWRSKFRSTVAMTVAYSRCLVKSINHYLYSAENSDQLKAVLIRCVFSSALKLVRDEAERVPDIIILFAQSITMTMSNIAKRQ